MKTVISVPVRRKAAEEIRVRGEFIRLDDLLKLAGDVSTGGEGKTVIQSGEVRVTGEVCTMRGKKLRDGDTAEHGGRRLLVRTEE